MSDDEALKELDVILEEFAKFILEVISQKELDYLSYLPKKGQTLRDKLLAWREQAIAAARLNELKKMPARAMNDPDDDTNVFWYRTYTKPEFEARWAELEAQYKENKDG